MMTTQRITKLAEAQKVLQSKVATLEDSLKDAKKRLRAISEGELPDAMDEEGINSFVLKSGGKISVEVKMFASLAKKNHPEIVAWLREINAESLIKHEVGVAFSKGQDAIAQDHLKTLLGDWGDNVYDRVTIHTGSVKSLVKELVADGHDVPVELLGLSTLRTAVLSHADVKPA